MFCCHTPSSPGFLTLFKKTPAKKAAGLSCLSYAYQALIRKKTVDF
jgi:hypothetical protein